MATREELLQEAFNRGLLDPQTASLFQEAQSRNLFRPEPTVGEAVTSTGSAFAKGIGDTILNVFKDSDVQNYNDAYNLQQKFDAIDRGEEVSRDIINPSMSAMLSAYANLPNQRADLRNQLDTRMNQGPYRGISTAINEFLDNTFTVDPSMEGRISTDIAYGLGNFSAMALEAAATRRLGVSNTGSLILPAWQGSAANAVGQFERTLRETDDLEKAFESADIGRIVGISEAVPIGVLFNRLDKASGGLVKKTIVNGLVEGTVETVQEAVTTILNNLSDQFVYNPERKVFEGVVEGAPVSFSVGSIAATVATLWSGRKGGKGTAGAQQAGDPPQNPVLPHEKGAAYQAADTIADVAARKSVSILNPYIEVTGEGSAAAELRDRMEHREKYEGAPGVVRPADWQEIKQTQVGDLYNPVERALARVRTSMLGRKIPAEREKILYDYVIGKKNLTGNTAAIQAAKAGDFSKLDALKGKDKEISNIVYAGDVIRDALGETKARMDDVGIKRGFSEIGGNMPLFFDTRQLKKNRGTFEQYLLQNGYADTIGEAREITSNIISNGGVPYLNEPDRKGGDNVPRGVIKKPFDPNKVPQQFVNKKLDGVLNNYFLKAAGRIAYSKQFGANGEILRDLVKRMGNEVYAAGGTVNSEDIKRVYDIADAMLSRYNPIRQQGMDSAYKGIAAFETLSTLGGATLSSIQEPFIVMERLGLTNFMKSFPVLLKQAVNGSLRTIHKQFADSTDAAAIAEDLGVALDAANLEVLTSTFSAEASKIQELFFRSPMGMFLHQWTRTVRIMASYAGVKMLDNYAGKFNAGKETTRIKQELYDLGIDPKDFKEFARRLQMENTTLEQVLIDNAKRPNQITERLLDMPLPSGLNARETVRPAIARIVNEIVMAPRATNRPLWLSNRWLSPIGQLKSFPITFGNTVMKRVLNKFNPKKNPNIRPCDVGNTIGAFAAMLGTAAAMLYVKDIYRGRDPDDRPSLEFAETPREFLQTELGEAINQTGIFGPFGMVTDSARFGPEGLLGPAVGDVVDLFDKVVKLADSDISLGDFMYYLGDRTTKAFGALGANKETGEAVGEWLYNQVEN